eukprot:g7766.t1
MGLGTWSWGNKFLWNYTTDMDPELQQVFNYALSKGINLFDTADSYGTGRLNGRSEMLLGEFIKDYKGSREVHIATKFAAYPWRVLPMNIVAAARGSLRRLDQEALSLGQLHWSTANYAPLQEIALQNGLADIYEKGLVKAIGVSNYGPKQLMKIYRRLEKRGVPLSSAQVQFSLLSYGSEQIELLEICKELDIAVIAYSPLALGLLTGKFSPDNLPTGPRGALFNRLLPKIQDVLMVVDEIAKRRKKSLTQVAVNWCICKGTIPIPGVKNMSQVKENIGALGWKLSPKEVSDLDEIAERTSGKMIQNIFQTK